MMRPVGCLVSLDLKHQKGYKTRGFSEPRAVVGFWQSSHSFKGVKQDFDYSACHLILVLLRKMEIVRPG